MAEFSKNTAGDAPGNSAPKQLQLDYTQNDMMLDQELQVGHSPAMFATDNKDFGEPSLGTEAMLEPGVFLDHMMFPMMGIQSEGLPSNGAPGRSSPNPQSMSKEELKSALMQQVEYYFSKDNLATDKYLLSQMDAESFVPITIVANFNQVKRLTSDVDLILEVVKESSVLQVDEQNEKIRAVPEKRCILILREIPQETPQQDIMNLFVGEKCPKFISCEFAENSCWYVTFESEDDAHKAFTFLREEVQTFLGQPIRARIKATTVQRSSGIPKKSRNTYPMQPMTRMPYYPQQSGMLPWTTPPNSSGTPNGMPYMKRGYYVPGGAAANGYISRQYGHSGRYNSYNQQQSNGRSGDSERGRPRNQRGFSPPIANGGPEGAGDRDRGNRSSRGGEYSRDYRGGDRSRYPREDNIPNIPRLNKKHAQRTMNSGSQNTREYTGEAKTVSWQQAQMRSQQSPDLAAANFPPLPTGEGGTTSPTATTTQPPTLETPDPKINSSNLADIVKGRKLKDAAPIVTANNHPPLQVTKTPVENIKTIEPASTPDTNQAAITSPTSKRSPPHSKPQTNTTDPSQSTLPSIASVVASNLTSPPKPPTTAPNVSSVSTPTSFSSAVVTSPVVPVVSDNVAITNSSTGNSTGPQDKPHQSRGQPKGDSKGQLRGERGYSGPRAGGPSRHTDKENPQSRHSNVNKNSQVLKDGRVPYSANRRNRDRDRKAGLNKNGSQRPSPKLPTKRNQTPKAPPPPPGPAKKSQVTEDPVDKKIDQDKSQPTAKNMEKLSYAQMIQRKKAPKPATESSSDKPAVTGTVSAPSSPNGAETVVTNEQITEVPKKVTDPTEGPLKPTVSKSAPNSPIRESSSSKLSTAKDE